MNLAWILLPLFLFQAEELDPKWSREEVEARIVEVFTEKEKKKVKVFRSRHYIIFSDSSAGKKFAKILDDQVFKGFQKTFPFKEKKNPRLMPIYLFKTKEAYWEFYARAFKAPLSAAKKSAGVSYKDFYTTYYASPRDPIHFHEGAHQIMKNVLELYGGGSWYQEGIAEHYEDKVRKFNRFANTRNAIRVGEALSLRDLMTRRSMLYSKGDNLKGYGGASGRYGQAASLILFLKDGPLKKGFEDFFFKMGNVKAGDAEKIEKVIQEVYGMTIEELDAEWKKYYSR